MHHLMKDRLAVVLAECRISKSEAARVSGLSRSVVRKILTGDSHNITLDTALTLAEALGLTLDWLAGRDVPGPKVVAVRYHFACKGGRVMGQVRDPNPDPINVMNGASKSMRGRFPRSAPPRARGPRSVDLAEGQGAGGGS